MIHLALHSDLVTVARIVIHPQYNRCGTHCDDFGKYIGWPPVLAAMIMVAIIIALSFVHPLRRRFGLYPNAAPPGGHGAPPGRYGPGGPAAPPPAPQTPPSSSGPALAADSAYEDPKYLGPGDWDGGPLDPPEYRTPPEDGTPPVSRHVEDES